MKLLLWAGLLLGAATALPAAKTLEVYFIDVEGGQATLVVSPGGESMLIDTGWPGRNRRDAERIAAAAKAAGVKRIDYLVATHYHDDHVGGVLQLAERLPIRNFVDHGPNMEKGAESLYAAWEDARSKGQHIVVKAGDTLPVKGLTVRVVSANGDVIAAPLPGAAGPTPDCAAFRKKADDTSENARSVGLFMEFNGFRLLNLADLTWNKEYGLVCPANKIGKVDVYMVSHHGMDLSGSPQLLQAIAPRVAIMENGARKGGSAEAWQTVRDAPGLEDFWQLHFTVGGGKEHNTADPFIANVDEACEGKWLRLTAKEDGSFTVSNSRNRYERTYAPR
jgi:competence protein ComEC